MSLWGNKIGNAFRVTSAAIAAVLGYTPFNPASLLRSYLASTVTYNNDDTLGDTALSVTVEAATKYGIQLQCPFGNAGAAAGLKVAFAGTATLTQIQGQWFAYNAAGQLSTGASATDATPFSSNVVEQGGQVVFIGSVEINAAGTFLLQGCQSEAEEADTTLNEGSTLVLTKN